MFWVDTYRKNLVNKVGQFTSRDWAILPIQLGKSMEDATHGVLTLCSLHLVTGPYCLSSWVQSREDTTHGVLTLCNSSFDLAVLSIQQSRSHGGYKPWSAYSMQFASFYLAILSIQEGSWRIQTTEGLLYVVRITWMGHIAYPAG